MSATQYDVMQEAEAIRRKRLNALGLADQYDLWRESMPDARSVSDQEAFDAFMNAQGVEQAALDGRVSVDTGGTDEAPATTIAAPGPDGEETGTDAPGDTSEGGTEETGLRAVEGMWQPPEEAEALNYSPPSTEDMAQTPEWLENAKAFHKFMGSPNPEADRVRTASPYFIEPPEIKEMTDEDIAEWARVRLSLFNWNVAETVSTAHKIMTSDDPKIALAYLNLINMYDHSDGGSIEFARALAGIATDPTTYTGLGVGSIAARGAAKATAKAGLKKAVQMAIVGGTAGAVEGASLAGGFNLAVQQVEKEAGVREEVEKAQVAKAAAIGGGAGTLLGGSVGALVGRHMDKLAVEAEKVLTDLLGGAAVKEERAAGKLSETQLIEMLEVSQRATGKAEKKDDVAAAVVRYLEEGEIPRKEDGSIDEVAFAAELKDLTITEQLPLEGKAKIRETDEPRKLTLVESEEFARRISMMERTAAKEVIAKTAALPGSYVRDPIEGTEFEVMGRTKNGWFNLRNRLTGEEVNKRRNQFEVLESRPKPQMAGPMELKPFTTSAARIMAMNEDVISGKLKKVKITTEEQQAFVKELQDMGVKIDEKTLASYWTPAELLFLRNTYNAQANGMADLVRIFSREVEDGGRLTDQQLAMFNEAHTQFVATRDLFFGVSGNAARQLQILKTRATDEVYEFSQALMDSISISGGRTNTERAIRLMADATKPENLAGKTRTGAMTAASDSIWGNKVASAFLIVRYNMMLSSLRTHFFNFLGNSASGVYQHLMVSPVRMGINNIAYARDLAKSVVNPKYKPDPADRLTRHQWYAELRGHYAGFRDSFALSKEIAMGRDIGEGKVWNELGLRYNVVNVPNSMFAKLGTTPVRMLEAGDAFFKNQYYTSKIHELASMKARTDEIHRGMDYEMQYNKYLNDPDAPMQRIAKDFAAKQTYTNDPSVYGGVLAALARGAAAAQNRSVAVNMIVPFVRTPANLLSYSMETIGANVLLSPNKTYNSIMKGSAQESQEALARLTVAAGLWLAVYEMYQNGNITGTGPTNWEERKVWEAAGWQANSIKIHDKWYGIERADPGGQSLVSIASIFDYYAMTQQQDKPAMEWIGAGLLYTADMVIDESYLSTASDVITAIQSKEESRARSVGASLINSVVVPNLVRDLRRPADPTQRSGASENLMDQVVKQMKNASPWHSEDLPPRRDWKGDPINSYGNAYERGLIPFNIRDSKDSDPASMALAYARIPVSTPNRTIDWPGGQGDSINLFAMDEGAGFVYDKYVEIVGKMRGRSVATAMGTTAWRRMVDLDNNGPGSDGEAVLRRALAIGSRLGRLQMLNFLIEHSGDNNTFHRANGDLIVIQHPVSVQEYKRLRREVRLEDVRVPEELRQYQIQERQEGPEFFKP